MDSVGNVFPAQEETKGLIMAQITLLTYKFSSGLS